jgi:copper transport protein
VMLFTGARNRRATKSETSHRQTAKRVGMETIALVGVIALTTLMTSAAPARVAVTRPFSTTLRSTTLLVDLTIDPARSGRNVVHLYVLTPTGRTRAVDDLTASASLPSKSIDSLRIAVVRAGSNHFQALGTDFPLKGTWRVDLTVKTDPFTEEVLSGSVTIE